MTPLLDARPLHGALSLRWAGRPARPVSAWSADGGAPLAVATLLRLRDEGAAAESGDGEELQVAWSAAAELADSTSESDLAVLGLPPPSGFGLEITLNGGLGRPDLDLGAVLLTGRRPVARWSRVGAWLTVGSRVFLLSSAAYSILEAVQAFNPGASVHDRYEWVARFRELLTAVSPAPKVDARLGRFRIVVCSAFEIEPFVRPEDGEPDFRPILGSRAAPQPGDAAPASTAVEPVFSPGLSEEERPVFARRFADLPEVDRGYPVPYGVVILTERVRSALRPVHRAMRGTRAERVAFLANPAAAIRDGLESGPPSNPASVDAVDPVAAVFSDYGLSDRIVGIGLWVGKTLPWVRRSGVPWLPPERFGLRIGDRVVELDESQLTALAAQLHPTDGAPVPDVVDLPKGVRVPATPDLIDGLDALLRQLPLRPDPDSEGPPTPPPSPPVGDPPLVLQVDENLETVRYTAGGQSGRSAGVDLGLARGTTLLPHQVECLTWLREHWCGGGTGSLLADDMGLGKTLQALAFLRCVADSPAGDGPFLVVAPTGLLENWKAEHARHFAPPGLGEPLMLYGAGLRRVRVSGSRADPETAPAAPGSAAPDPTVDSLVLSKLDLAQLSSAPWVLTTYETLRDYQHSLARVRWRAVVFDEAQRIKNPGACVTDAALALNADFVLVATGTPVENRPADIWPLLDRVVPGRFGSLREFSRRYENDGSGSDAGADLAVLHRRLTTASGGAPAVMLRRLKDGVVSGLPVKIVHRLPVVMPGVQADAYAEAVRAGRGAAKGRILAVLQRLRDVSLHPYGPAAVRADEYVAASGRLSETFRILRTVRAAGEKALVFIESIAMQDFLKAAAGPLLDLAIDPLVVNGAVAGPARKRRVDEFQGRDGFGYMILSPRAGGVGLTLTAANHVIHLSRWWNPAVEDQCTDRVFRIGQSRPVHVYLPLARHPEYGDASFDVKLDALLERKRDMNRRVLAPSAVDRAETRHLFDETVGGSAVPGTSSDSTASGPFGSDLASLEPEEFERRVMDALAASGHRARRTPRSGDAGADVVAVGASAGDRAYTLIVQCKHLQSGRPCPASAVEEVLSAISRYRGVEGVSVPMVVTSAESFAEAAQQLARERGVVLVARNGLAGLVTYRFEGGQDQSALHSPR